MNLDTIPRSGKSPKELHIAWYFFIDVKITKIKVYFLGRNLDAKNKTMKGAAETEERREGRTYQISLTKMRCAMLVLYKSNI